MVEVVNFFDKVREKKDLIWICDCKCCSFLIHEHGDIECVDCGVVQTGHCELSVHAWLKRETKKAK